MTLSFTRTFQLLGPATMMDLGNVIAERAPRRKINCNPAFFCVPRERYYGVRQDELPFARLHIEPRMRS